MEAKNELIKLSPEDLEFLANHTNTSRAVVDKLNEEFLVKYPDGKISKEGFEKMMHVLVSFSMKNQSHHYNSIFCTYLAINFPKC